ncbi:hypothetical protein PFISCL1PPCAC_26195 [Pristionchus fissidentatus]|uniref:Uncharacterized protein n=1 Tax=Pristionchus fissidentatus TaxID=1538716 RepID=A0AAV5WW33_9BILA|nr:hypothetical protein PFISCL1PPCAC_26195 [Pristionchus fissidentatus]
MIASRLLLRSLRVGVSRVSSRADATNRPAIFLPASERKNEFAEVEVPSPSERAKQSLILQKEGEVDPMEGPSGLKSEDLMAQLRQVYYEEDPDTALERSTDSSRESGRSAFRKIVYNEGELDGSDLTKPPSRSNPHPFDTSLLPPSHSRSLAPYVNHVPLLRVLVDIGVDLFEIECKYPAVPRRLLRLPYSEARSKIRWLVSIGDLNYFLLGFTPDSLGEYLTRNPFVLLQNLDDLKTRVNYLESIKFTRPEILKLVSEFRFWLNIDVKTTEKRLDTVTGMFGLRKSMMRKALVKEPRLLMFGLGPIKRIWDLLTNEFCLSADAVKGMLIEDPRLFIMDARVLIANFGYATRVMRLEKEQVARNPLLLRVALHALRSRHEFLRTLGRARYVEGQAAKGLEEGEIISISDLLLASDAEFAEKVARVTPASYDIYLRSH